MNGRMAQATTWPLSSQSSSFEGALQAPSFRGAAVQQAFSLEHGTELKLNQSPSSLSACCWLARAAETCDAARQLSWESLKGCIAGTPES